MKQFDLLVGEQLRTMDRLLDLQLELEQYERLAASCEQEQLSAVQEEIVQRIKELHQVQALFEEQTQQVIQTFQQEKSYTS